MMLKRKNKPYPIICCIYLIVCKKTGQIYVGKAENFYNRINDHIKGTGIVCNSIIDIMIAELGVDSFSVFILKKVSKSRLKREEDFWIKKLKANIGLNFNAYEKSERCIQHRFMSHSDIINSIKQKYIVR